jgi:hypothetical protein
LKKLKTHQARNNVRKSQAGNNRYHRKRKSTAVKQSYRSLRVTAWDGEVIENIICLGRPTNPPKTLSFQSNTSQTLKFLQHVKNGVHSRSSDNNVNWIERQKGKTPRVKKYVEFAEMESISPSVALVLAAIYERAKTAIGKTPPAINFENWSQQVFQTFYEIGFFEIIGHNTALEITEFYDERVDASYRVSKTITGSNANELKSASEIIVSLLSYLELSEDMSDDIIPEVNGAISEAMINVSRHAYPDTFVESQDSICLKKWWMTAKANKADNRLTIALYDQGATIPGTLPKQVWYKEMASTVMKKIAPFSEPRIVDHEFINFSMLRGNTQTGHAGRGLGLPQMKELIDSCTDGCLTVISRQGLYRYDKNAGVFKQRLDTPLEGTLIEWELALPHGRTI